MTGPYAPERHEVAYLPHCERCGIRATVETDETMCEECRLEEEEEEDDEH